MGNMCCMSPSDSRDEIEMSPSLTLDRILMVFLLCFEAAIDSLPFSPPILSTTRQVPTGLLPWLPSHMEVWEFRRDCESLPVRGPHDLEGLPASYRRVHSALRKMYWCDHFCFLLEVPLRKKLEELNLGTVRWMRFMPRPLVFYAEIMPGQDSASSHLDFLDEEPPSIHSALQITTSRGEELIFDGTPEQFGWSDLAWTQDKAVIAAYYVEGQEGIWEYDDCLKEELKELILQSNRIYWATLFSQMEELVSEFDWNELEALHHEVLWETVSRQAQRKFAVGQR